MLWALTNTAWAEVLIEATDTTELFADDAGARNIRNSLLCILVCCSHLWFFIHVIKGFFSQIYYAQRSDDTMKVLEQGLDTSLLRGGSRTLFIKIIRLLVKNQIKHSGELTFARFERRLKALVGTTAYIEKLTKEQNEDAADVQTLEDPGKENYEKVEEATGVAMMIAVGGTS